MKRFLIAVGILLSLTTLALGAGELQSYYKAKFLGINNRVSEKLLSDDESPDCSNITLQETGAIQDRDVFGQYNSTAGALGNNPVTGLFKFYGPVQKYFVCSTGNKLFSGSGGTWSDITQAGLTPTQGSYWSACSGVSGDVIAFYLFNQSVPMQRWNGTGLTTTPAGVPGTNCSYGAVHKGRVWAMGSAIVPYRLYFSSINTGDDWTTSGGFIDLPDESAVPTGIMSWGGYLYIFTESNIWVLSGSTPNDFALRKTSSQVGAVAPRSIKVTDIGIMFLARTGVFVFNGNSSIKVSDKIENTINNLSTVYVQNSCAVYDGQQRYWLSVCEKPSTINNLILIYDITLKEWYKYNNLYLATFERAVGGTDKGELYGGSSDAKGIVYKLQAASGTESITHASAADFNSQVTYHTVVNLNDRVYMERNGNDNFTKMLLHFNGANNDTSSFDSSLSHNTVTFVGDAKLNSTIKEYGTTSVYLDGTGDYVNVADSDGFYFEDKDFTIDFWVYHTSLTGTGGTICYLSQYESANDYWEIYKLNNGQIYVIFRTGGAFTGRFFTPAISSITEVNKWYHVAFIRHNSLPYLYVDGVIQPLTTTDAFGFIGDNASDVHVGYETGGFAYLTGYMDEVRISKGIARWTVAFTPYLSEYCYPNLYGSLTSRNLQINAAGLTTLDRITWTASEPSWTKLTFQTRTGSTDDSVNFNNWQYWSSASTVTFDTVTDGTASFVSDITTTGLEVFHPENPQVRNILYYEDEDAASPNCVSFLTVGYASKGKYAIGTIPIKDLSGYNWISGWYKSPNSGNSVEFSFGERTHDENVVTFNTVNVNTWERWYYHIGYIPAASRNEVSQISIRYLGDAPGSLIYGGFEGYNFYDSGDVITSVPDDFIEYRGIFSASGSTVTPELYNVTLTYTPALTTNETNLNTYYYTKWIDFGTPQVDKQYLDFFMDAYCEVTPCTVYMDYDIDNGTKTGTITIPVTVTNNTVKVRKYFPASTFGKTMRMKFYKTSTGSTIPKLTIRGVEVRFRTEGFN